MNVLQLLCVASLATSAIAGFQLKVSQVVQSKEAATSTTTTQQQQQQQPQ